MSVFLTEAAVVERRKTVTRRLGWQFLKPGDRLTLCRKVQGRKKGEPLVRLAEVEVVSAERVPLVSISVDDIRRECVPLSCFDEVVLVDDGVDFWRPEPYEWARWFAEAMDLPAMTQAEFDDFQVTRIEWRYLLEVEG